MSKKPETLFKEKVISFLKTLKNCWYVKTQQVSIRGTPDILMCIHGCFIALELKSSRSAKLDVLQELNINRINMAKGIGLVVSPENWLEVKGVLEILSKGGHYDRVYSRAD